MIDWVGLSRTGRTNLVLLLLEECFPSFRENNKPAIANPTASWSWQSVDKYQLDDTSCFLSVELFVCV